MVGGWWLFCLKVREFCFRLSNFSDRALLVFWVNGLKMKLPLLGKKSYDAGGQVKAVKFSGTKHAVVCKFFIKSLKYHFHTFPLVTDKGLISMSHVTSGRGTVTQTIIEGEFKGLEIISQRSDAPLIVTTCRTAGVTFMLLIGN